MPTDSVTITFKLNSLPPRGSSGAPILYCGSWGNMPYVDPSGHLRCSLFDDSTAPIILAPGTEYSILYNSSMLSCGGAYARKDGTTFVSDVLHLFGYGYNYADITISSVVIEHASGHKTTLIAATKDGKPCMYNKSTGIALYPSPSDGLVIPED